VRLLLTAEVLGHRSLSLYESRARFRHALGEADAAQADDREAKRLQPAAFWDLHQKAYELAEAGRWQEVSDQLRIALALRPDDYWTLFRMARAQENLGRLDGAEALFRSCIALRPNDPTAHNSRGNVLLRQGRWEEAAAEFETSIQQAPDYLPAYGNLMLAHAERKQLAEAEAVLRRCLARQLPPLAQASAWNNRGVACERAGDLPGALGHYDTAVRLGPKEATFLRNRALVLGRQGHFADAERAIHRAIGLEPQRGELRYVLGNLCADQGRAEEAVDAYTAALQCAPRFRPALNNRGELLRRLGRYQEALRDQEQVLVQTPNDPDALYNRSLTLAALKQFRAALEDVNRAAVLREGDAGILLLRGKVWGDLGALQESERDLTRAIELAPEEADGYRSRAVTRMKAEDWDGALADFREYLKRRPNAADGAGVYNDMSKALGALGQHQAALEALDEAVARKRAPTALANRGNLLLQKGDLARAVADLDESLRLAPGDARALALRGTVRLRQGRPDDALADLDRTLALTRENLYETLVLRALAQWGRDKRQAAQADLERVARERPNHVRGKFARGLLRLEGKQFADAVTEFSQASDDPVLCPFALALRARAWLGTGGAGVAAGLGDANRLAEAFGQEGYALLEAARIHARALASAAPGTADGLRDRALELLAKGLEREPDLRPGLKNDPDLRALQGDPRFKKLTGED